MKRLKMYQGKSTKDKAVKYGGQKKLKVLQKKRDCIRNGYIQTDIKIKKRAFKLRDRQEE